MSGLRPPAQIGSVRLLEPLGEGGMALVFRGEDRFRPGVQSAVKLLRPEVHRDADLVRRFLREGDVLTRLSHPSLVEIHSFGTSGAWPYLIMELLPGGSLKDCRGEAPAALVRRLVPVCGALAVAHAAGVVHRDLKPSNMLFAGDGHLKVTDFGVCFWEGEEGRTRATRSQMVVGTLGYMAPEQHGDPRRVDGRCDVYALGAILFEFTTGQPYAQVQLPPAAVRPGFPPRLAGIIMRALQPDPAKRMADMNTFGHELSTWLDSAEAVGWGEEPLPGFAARDREQATVAGPRREEGVENRLGPYLDALGTGPVGARRAAAEGLVCGVRPGDGPWLEAALARAPEGARFALARALGKVGGAEALQPLLGLLSDPFAQREAAEAAADVALRTGQLESARAALSEAGLGAPWRWTARAALGDEAWVRALVVEWPRLTPPFRLQSLEACRSLPEGLRARAKAATADASGQARSLWESL
ncbi:serine/threonine-protein kinase [Geothrix sp. PMB-07]|uniref:serine/threonine-protein kinase n=1 Tax=Geothrix sp. PMB-07 TaxID=3068640 RepID=UPI002741DF92|nr:serine/threonine-protein kinase [Geothrix sp. PMB-07]WLT31118.1 serine/threonine-protein kinase [Geothrix sp. PMB-07]